MSTKQRARRLQRDHRRMNNTPKLNLVALMDIFTILVFFLMVNNGDVEVLQADKNIALPESVAEQKPEVSLVVKISDSHIVVQGREIASIDKVMREPAMVIASLATELNYQAARAEERGQEAASTGREVVIMGDSDMPYALLKKIMTTCADTGYRDVALAVNSIAGASPEPGAQVAAR